MRFNGKPLSAFGQFDVRDLEEANVELSLLDGDQVVVPTKTAGLSKVIIAKPVTLIPKNIADGVTIAGVTGEHKGGTVEGVHYVTFMSDDGSTKLYEKAVLDGDNCMNPISMGWLNPPVKEPTNTETFEQNGWSFYPGESADDFALAIVTEDRTVYAAFKASTRYYTVRFFDGETLLKTEQIAYGGTATPPEVTSESGYIFNGWEPADFTIIADTDFVCLWNEDTSKIIVVKEQSVETTLDDGSNAYVGKVTPIVKPVAENAYVVVFDGVEYECTAKNISSTFSALTVKSAPGIGNPYEWQKSYGYKRTGTVYTDTGGAVPQTTEPFYMSCGVTDITLYTQRSGSTHTLFVYMRNE